MKKINKYFNHILNKIDTEWHGMIKVSLAVILVSIISIPISIIMKPFSQNIKSFIDASIIPFLYFFTVAIILGIIAHFYLYFKLSKEVQLRTYNLESKSKDLTDLKKGYGLSLLIFIIMLITMIVTLMDKTS